MFLFLITWQHFKYLASETTCQVISWEDTFANGNAMWKGTKKKEDINVIKIQKRLKG